MLVKAALKKLFKRPWTTIDLRNTKSYIDDTKGNHALYSKISEMIDLLDICLYANRSGGDVSYMNNLHDRGTLKNIKATLHRYKIRYVMNPVDKVPIEHKFSFGLINTISSLDFRKITPYSRKLDLRSKIPFSKNIVYKRTVCPIEDE